jgi:curli biogenesis system outer membrane secretion channel CsgG
MKLFYSAVFLFLMAGTQSFAQVKAKKPAPKPTAKAPVAAPVPEEKPIAGDPSKDNVAIYPFTSAAGYDYDYAESVGNAIESGFVRSTRFNVVERNRFGSISQEERFKEVNTDNVVRAAAKLGAKYIITGYVTGANINSVYNTYDHQLQGYQASISVSFKIIEVESSLIKTSESINIVGSGGTPALAKGSAYASIDEITRRIIASNFPQRFKFMSVGTTEIKKKVPVLTTFKFWGGSDNGVKVGDAVEVYILSYVTNPSTNKQVEEKNSLGIATITAVNSGSTSTCEVYKPQKYGAQMLDAITKSPDLVTIEYTGGVKPRGFFDF